MALRWEEISDVSDHGGSLTRAAELFPDAPRPLVDLSTGINPHSYPFSALPATSFTRLPEPMREARLRALAADAYGAGGAEFVAAAPGTQILLPQVARLIAPGRARILSPTYAEHARAAVLAGHRVEEVGGLESLADADLAVLVNPNNPDGRLLDRAVLAELAAAMRRRQGLLVVDEAFMDAHDEEGMAGEVSRGGVVVLRSFGKFYGLAGIRLGFAIAESRVAARLRSLLGPWAVSGPALEIGLQGLADNDWRTAMRARLATEAARLNALLSDAGFEPAGGTSLFRFLRSPLAGRLFDALGHAGILARRFEGRPEELRLGLPGDEVDWQRLSAALAAFAGDKREGATS